MRPMKRRPNTAIRLFAIVLPALPLHAPVALGQAAPAPTGAQAKTPYTATVREDSALVRAAPSVESGYPFGRLDQGVAVRVVEEQVGWVRIATEGDAFEGWYGFVQAGPGVTKSADGTKLQIASRAQVNAPNAEGGFEPDNSWKAIGFLAAGDELALLDEVAGKRDTYYRVALDGRTSGWVAASAIAREGAAATTPAPAPETKPTPAPAPAATTTEAPAEGAGAAAAESAESDTDTEVPPTPDTGAAETTTGEKPEAEAPKTQEEARAQVVEQVKRVRFSDIDAIWKRIAKAPVETAELEQLRDRFLALAEAEATPRGERALANSRAEQIALRIEVQKSLLEVAALRNRKNADTKGVADLELAMRTRQPYDIVGRINASAVFNGDRLPLLYRLQDPGTGQTIAYIVPGPGFDLSSMLGLLIGVKGPMRYDDSLRLNTVTPALIDVLGSSPAPQVATPGAAE